MVNTSSDSVKSRIQADVIAAMKAKESTRLGTLRMLQAAIKQKEVDERIQLDDAAVLAILQKMIKQRHEAATQFTQGHRPELADKELAEITLLQVYLPQPLSEAEIDALIQNALAQTGASTLAEMGKVMALLKDKLQGRADMSQVSAKIRAKLG